MKLKIKYILFVSFIHIILILLSLRMFKENIYYFIAAEFFIICTIIIAIILYRQFIQPINTISSGIESLEDKDFSMKFVKVGHLEMDQLIGVYNRMIDQLREERIKQREQHFFLQHLIESSPSGIIILNFDEIITQINPAAGSFLGLSSEKIIGKTFDKLPGKLPMELNKLLSGNSEIIPISGMKTFKCQKASFVDRGFNHHFILIEELTDELLKTERKAYEKVIRMMSHELNNSLGAVNSILNTCLNFKDQLQKKDKKSYEEALNVAIERNTHLNRFMENFANVVRIPLPKKIETDLHELLKNVGKFIFTDIEKRNIKLKWELDSKPLMVKLDKQQMEQVLVNIFKNAMEAIEKNGEITIITTPNRQLIIRDNGKGIPEDIQQKLFTPFFSTKKNGQGIGLTVTREILLNHGFKFSLETNEKEETEFVVEF
ncbi:MAG: PAS domain-containing protein [Armatimonadetes bacterium]|nr:PAS domain-containing protein [Armatimonadota bacterium]